MSNNWKVNLWKRDFSLPILYDCYEGEEILPSQENALKLLIKHPESRTKALESVRKYILTDPKADIPDNTITNIFRYLMPKQLYLPRRAGKCVAVLVCNYRFDPEHGIGIVFKDGLLENVGMLDMVL